MSKLSVEELQAFCEREFPHSPSIIESVGNMRARVRLPSSGFTSRPGNMVSGPTLMAMADHVTYVAILAEIGMVPQAVTTNLNIDFLHPPSRDHDLVAEGELLKLGKRLAIADVRITSEGTQGIVAHANVTYWIPPNI